MNLKSKIYSLATLSFLSMGMVACSENNNGPDPDQPEQPTVEFGTVEFSYASGNADIFGRPRKQVYDVAMCINEPSLAGKSITKITSYISSVEGLGDASIWLSSALNLDKEGYNAPDIKTWNVTPALASYGGLNNLGMLTIELAEPYQMTADPLYVGYSFNVEDIATQEQQYPIVVTPGKNENGFWLHATQSVLNWRNYFETAEKHVPVIIVELEGEFLNAAVSIASVKEGLAENGADSYIEASIINSGTSDINQLDYVYSINDNVVEKHIDFETPIAPNFATPTNVYLPIDPIDENGEFTIDITITQVNKILNTAEQANVTTSIAVVDHIPFMRPLVEEFTSLGCGYCPRGLIGMDLIKERYAETATPICYHLWFQGNDPMQVSQAPVKYDGLPQAAINRTKPLVDPYYGNNNEDFGISIDLDALIAQQAKASINILSATLDANNNVNIECEATFVRSASNVNYAFGYVVTCDGLHSENWFQSNYYSGNKNLAGTLLADLASLPSSAPNLTYNDVAINNDAQMGVRNSIPATIESGKTYTHSYSLNIGNASVVKDPATSHYDPKNLGVAAFIVDMTTNTVINSTNIHVN